MIKQYILLIMMIAALATALTACGGSEIEPTAVSPTDSPATAVVPPPTDTPIPPTATTVPPTAMPEPSPAPVELLQQWAFEAAASSEYGSEDWTAQQATGEPNTPECGDIKTAWASEVSAGIDLLDVYYEIPVYATTINIHQTYNPDQVVQVDLIDLNGEIVPAYSQEQHEIDDEACPYILTLDVDQTDFLVQGVRITVDQSFLESWNEIDAVELIGVAGEGTAVRPVPPEAPPIVFDTPAGFLWRDGGEDVFSSPDGMDVSADGFIYVTDTMSGIWIYDTEGNQIGTIDHDELRLPEDIKVAPDGNVYVTDWASNQIFVFAPDGTLITQFGEEGVGDGQFGTFSPSAVAIDQDGMVYVLDENEDSAGEEYDRIQKFTADGTFLEWFPLEQELFAASNMDIGPDGNLYIIGFFGDIMKMDSGGNVLALFEDVLNFAGPQQIALDDDGNMYVSVWSEAGVVKMDALGNIVARFGVEVEPGSRDWPAGGFYTPEGLAVLPDGSMVFVADEANLYSYITAFTFVDE